jgi:hypothetical protein
MLSVPFGAIQARAQPQNLDPVRGAEEVSREYEKRIVVCGKQDFRMCGRRFGPGDDTGGLNLGYTLGK